MFISYKEIYYPVFNFQLIAFLVRFLSFHLQSRCNLPGMKTTKHENGKEKAGLFHAESKPVPISTFSFLFVQ
jgi:hypothetical protein